MATISDRPITPAQVRAIHVALPRRGIDDDEYRGLLRDRFGVDTCKKLNRRQASELLLALGRALPQPPGGKRKPRRRQPAPHATAGANVRQMVTPGQRRLIETLAGEIAWREADGYRRWLGKFMSLERVATAAQAARVIEGLKAMRRRQDA